MSRFHLIRPSSALSVADRREPIWIQFVRDDGVCRPSSVLAWSVAVICTRSDFIGTKVAIVYFLRTPLPDPAPRRTALVTSYQLL